jgi:hypothetical protein
VRAANVAEEALGRRVDPPDDPVRVEDVARNGDRNERPFDVPSERELTVVVTIGTVWPSPRVLSYERAPEAPSEGRTPDAHAEARASGGVPSR